MGMLSPNGEKLSSEFTYFMEIYWANANPGVSLHEIWGRVIFGSKNSTISIQEQLHEE